MILFVIFSKSEMLKFNLVGFSSILLSSVHFIYVYEPIKNSFESV